MKIYITYNDDGYEGFGKQYWVLEDNAKAYAEKYNETYHPFMCVVGAMYTVD